MGKSPFNQPNIMPQLVVVPVFDLAGVLGVADELFGEEGVLLGNAGFEQFHQTGNEQHGMKGQVVFAGSFEVQGLVNPVAPQLVAR